MFKKNVWVVGILAVLAIMFMGCVDALPPTEGEIVELVNLQSLIADVPDGEITNWGSVFKGTAFQKCGSPTFTIITEDGVKKLKIDGMKNGWGEGLDLYNDDNAADDIVGVGFRAGDVITILGKINPVGNGLKMGNGSGKAKFDQWTSGATFDKTYTLTQNNIGEIKGANPKAVRFSYADPDGDARKGTIIFEQIIVKGLRGGGVEDVDIDDFVISGRLQLKDWVEGVTITPKKGKTQGKQTIYYQSEDGKKQRKSGYQQVGDADTINTGTAEFYVLEWKNASDHSKGTQRKSPLTVTTDADNGLTGDDKIENEKIMVDIFGETYPRSKVIPQTLGAYRVRFDVAAAKGYNAATGFSAGTMNVVDSIPDPKTVTGADLKALITLHNGGAWSNSATTLEKEERIMGPDSVKDWVFIRAGTLGTIDWTAVTPLALRNFTIVDTPRYILKLDDNWKKYQEIAITFDIIKTSIFSGDNGAKAQMICRRNQGSAGAWADGDIDYPEYPISGVNTFTRVYKVSKIDNGNANVTGLMFGGNNTTAFIFKIKSVTYKYED